MAAAQEGVCVAHDPLLGRILLATRAFVPGDVVLQEPPLLRWHANRLPSSLLAAVAAASAEARTLFFDMGHPDLDCGSVVVATRAATARAWVAAHPDSEYDTDTVLRILLIADTNAHKYRGEVGADDGLGDTAMYGLASKAAHSCRPNTYYSSKAGGGLRFIASRPIAQGEQVTTSYLICLTMPRAARRARLQLSKHFDCACARCRDRDDCRGLRCRCGGVAFHTDAQGWECAGCGAAQAAEWMAEKEAEEAGLREEVAGLDTALAAGTATGGPRQIEALVSRLETALSPTHALVASALETQLGWATAQKQAVIRASRTTGAAAFPMPWGAMCGVADFAAVAAAAGSSSIRINECLAAGCSGVDCTGGHPPADEAIRYVLYCVADHLIAGNAAAAGAVAQRYLPLITATYGADDVDVARCRRAAAAAPAQCAARGCGATEAPPLVFKACGGCRVVRYCGPACARAHWKAHKPACRAAGP